MPAPDCHICERCEPEMDSLVSEVKRLREQHQAVLHMINLYGDETLHKALDSIGWVPRSEGAND
jgi:hypothetical protein